MSRGNLFAAMLIVISCLFFAGAGAIVKLLGGSSAGEVRLHPLQIVAARYLFGFLTVLPFFLLSREARLPPRAPMRLHLGRVVSGAAGVACMFTAVTVLPLADVMAISFSAPLFTMLFAVLFLGEIVGIRRGLAAGVGFIGVLVMIRPSTSSFELMALVALASALFTGAEVTFLRPIAQRDHPLTVLLVNNGLAAVMAGLAAFSVLRWPSLEQWPLVVAIGAIMVSGQFLFVNAMARSEAGFLAPFSYATILFAALYGILFFDEVPDWISFAGAGLIVASGLYISFRTRTVNRVTREAASP